MPAPSASGGHWTNENKQRFEISTAKQNHDYCGPSQHYRFPSWRRRRRAGSRRRRHMRNGPWDSSPTFDRYERHHGIESGETSVQVTPTRSKARHDSPREVADTKSRTQRPAICAVMQPKLGANPWREALRPAPRPMLGAIVGVDEHREVRDGLVELYVHCVRMGRDGNRFMCGSWVPEWVVQGQRENVVLSYWRGLGGRDVALGPRKRHYPLKILARSCGGWCLVQWIGYPSWPPFATWVRRPDW
ncbi:hypothetical protein GGR57DRAFT_476886 [Xylariaceae sp. FL1272]|nr:hypothetical protein GGR57DRAFT_476886 [Xylariaceae sp. FL1272]